MQFWDENVVFSYKDTQIQYSVSDHIRFTAKNNKLFWKYYISTKCEVGMKTSLHIEPLVLDFGAIPKRM